MRRVPEVIDGWYDSGAMPFAAMGYPRLNATEFAEQYPADFICEALDQTRGWFYSLLAESTLLFDETAYRNVVCLGHILDGEADGATPARRGEAPGEPSGVPAHRHGTGGEGRVMEQDERGEARAGGVGGHDGRPFCHGVGRLRQGLRNPLLYRSGCYDLAARQIGRAHV